jgi:DnaK suppressor protein
MIRKLTASDELFIQKQRDRLTKLRQELLSATQSELSEETGLNAASTAAAHEYEDDAQRLALLEIEGATGVRSQQRLVQVERALQKITDGTYGLSDVSGEAIPRDRLEAMPESIYTIAESKSLEAKKS